jgi:ABC-2 type transport system permease protein
MLAIFKRQLAKNWLMILGWGLGLGFLGGYVLDIYESFFEKNVNLTQFMEAFPEDLLAFFSSSGDLLSVEGFLGIEFFSYLPVILGIVVITGAGKLIARQEENGTLELILAQPIGRSAVFWSKLLALIVSIALIMFLTWSGFAVGIARADTIDLTYGEILRPIVSLFAVVLVFLSLSLMLSMILPSSNGAGLAAGFVLIASFFITSLSRVNENLEEINRFSPLKYYQGGEAMSGLDHEALLILFGLSVVFIGVAWFFFVRRDLRFGGSGGIRLVVKRDEDK